MKALVSGASGFIGSQLVPRLVADGWDVTLVGRPTSKFADAIGNLERIDYTDDRSAFAADVKACNPDVCFHLATYFTAAHEPAELDPLLEANLTFSTHLIDALSHLDDVAFVNVGTIWQHFDGQAYSPVSLYAATKQAFAAIAQYYAECTLLRVVNLELTDSYGAGDSRKKLVRLLLDATESGEAMQLSGGEQYFDAIHVDDVVDALLLAANHADHNATSYAVRSEDPLTLRQFVDAFSEVLGRPVPVAWGARPYRPREMMQPWQYTPVLPEWKPTVSLKTGLRPFLDN